MVHSPARWPPYGRPETSRLLIKADHYMRRFRIKKRSDAYHHSARIPTMRGPGGSQELRSPVHHKRYGPPDCGVCTRRFEGLHIWSGPQGRRDPIRRLDRSLRGLRRAVEHAAEGQENNRGTSQGCSRRGEEVIKISQSLNSVIAADLRSRSRRPHGIGRPNSWRDLLDPSEVPMLSHALAPRRCSETSSQEAPRAW
jgi:hypothetical protein